MPWLVAVSLFMENLDATIVNTAVPTMSAALGVPPLSLKAVLTSYTLSLAVFIPISGWMADRFGTRRVFAAAVALFSVGSLACGLAMSVPMLVVSRILQGMGGAMMTPVGRIALVRSFPRSELVTVMQFVVIPALIGPLIGPFVGGVIVHWLPWRTIFLVNLPFGFLGLWMIRRYMPDFREENAPPLDRIGFVLFGAGVGLLSYVLEVFGEHRLSAGPVIGLTALSLALLAAYGWHARRAATRRCCGSRCCAFARFAWRCWADLSPGSAWEECRFCCRCSTRSAWASQPGRRACSPCRRPWPRWA